ncbi:UbiH/UbiF/VisC/COQ6 family ubiquinone biosynthesis hydroxylase [Paracoccaceae bacterium]|nr:UbiH/UbiF/VisC/COQ6 family ubiquinone biosynthesis hydroxylase [Paracoccaceae bacterium]
MEVDSDIIIVGGGLNGSLMAIAAANIGFSTIVLDSKDNEASVENRFDGRSYALALSSVRLLKNLDIFKDIIDKSQPILDIKILDGKLVQGPSQFSLHFDNNEIHDGPMGQMVEDRFIRKALFTKINKNEQIDYKFNSKVTEHKKQSGYISVTLDNGKKLDTKLLVGADGRNSELANRAEIKKSGWKYNQSALVCAIEHEADHNGVAWQYFMPSGPLAVLPMTGKRSCIVWTEQNANAKAINLFDETRYTKILAARLGNFLGKFKIIGDRHTYPLELSIADQFIDERLALIGDAAHSVHPIAGQGLNAGFKDIAVLAHIIQDAHNRGEDLGSLGVLKRYEEWRRFDSAQLAYSTDLFNKLFSNENEALRLARNIGLKLLDSIPVAKRNIIKEAAGITGELPRLMH